MLAACSAAHGLQTPARGVAQRATAIGRSCRATIFLIDVRTLPLLRARYIEKRVITFKDIEAARDRIAGAVYYSPCRPSIPLSETRAWKFSASSTTCSARAVLRNEAHATPSRTSRPTKKNEA